MSDTDATQARQDVVADVDEILEHVINGNMLSMPYDVYSELFDAVAGLGVKVEKLQSENAELRKRLAQARDPQRIGGTADPESFVYAIEQLREFRWQHATNDEEAIPYINNVADAHEREDAKLRKLVRDYERCTVHADCSMCEYDGKLSTHCPLSPCFPDADELSELGVEVPDD